MILSLISCGSLDINTLKYALIDPKTHTVTFIGKYDPEYNTVPIPYPILNFMEMQAKED